MLGARDEKGFLQNWLKWGPRKAGEWGKWSEPSPTVPGLDCSRWRPAGSGVGSPSGHALRAAAAAGVDCILRPKAGGGRPEPPEPTPGRHLSAQQLPRVTRRPKRAERRVESPGTRLTRRVCSRRTQRPGRLCAQRLKCASAA